MQGTKFHLPCTKLIRHHFGRIVNVFPDLACRLFPEFSNCEDCETATTDSSEEANSRNKDYIHPFHRTIAVRRGLLAEESADMMQSFFQMRRLQTKGAQQTSTPLDKVVPWTRALRWFPSVLKRLNVPNRWFHFWCSIHGFCQVFCSLLAPPVSNSYASPSALHVVGNVWLFLEQRLCVYSCDYRSTLKVYSILPFFCFVTLSRDLDQRHWGSSISHTVCLSSSWNLIGVDCSCVVAIAVTRDMCKQSKWWFPLLRNCNLDWNKFHFWHSHKDHVWFWSSFAVLFSLPVWHLYGPHPPLCMLLSTANSFWNSGCMITNVITVQPFQNAE